MNKIHLCLGRFTKKKKKNRKTQIKLEMQEVSQLIPKKYESLKGYYKEFYGNKLNNLQEIKQFLRTYYLPKTMKK